jgi:hypothetical protein
MVPSTPPEQLVAPLGGGAHVPTVLPEAMVHPPVQQSVSRAQISPCWMQKDDPSWHLPLVQRLEQHSVSFAHALPAVRQAVLSGAQVPPVHVPLQHFEPTVHALPSEMHAFAAAHLPALHWRLQQSVETVQFPPEPTHVFPMVV